MIITDTEGTPRTQRERHAHILGWGADLDHADRPAYPMERTPPRLPYPMPPPEQQHSHAEVLVSTERPRITRVYGTAQPPKGLSGWLRRQAFYHSENDLRRWLMLLLADRVNVGEGLVEDLARGHVPNLYAEMGGRAELMHNPKGAARKVAIGIAAVALLALALQRRRSGRRAGLR
ncbi:hypothetical protein QTI51_32410 [Variovorax sp. J22G73]|uniref:hypothetical protein n=1 Tax=unclassified Variovorax TaxID=663243 RepID=UPI002576946A|nr:MULTISPECIES: hypothetical protein [unclassified Variovorax]MDM0009510.1 hypothetical protein [Variovorax sp. J22R203]MDM0102018.1 hypothetical protein [Variovorax sp. J22G73]